MASVWPRGGLAVNLADRILVMACDKEEDRKVDDNRHKIMTMMTTTTMTNKKRLRKKRIGEISSQRGRPQGFGPRLVVRPMKNNYHLEEGRMSGVTV